MKLHRIVPNVGPYVSDYTQAQESTIDSLESSLSYPVQSLVAENGRFFLPVWADGDGEYFAIARNGGTIAL